MSAQVISILGFSTFFVRLASDAVNPSLVTYLDATGLSFFAEASTDYAIEFSVIYSVPASTDGISLAVNGPAAPVSVVGFQAVPANASPYTGFVVYDGSTVNIASTFAGLNHAKLHCILRNGLTAGTFILRFKAEAGAVTIKAGSSLRYRKVSL